MLAFTPGLDIHALADAGLITAQQYDAAMRYRALWLAYRQPWAASVTIPWGEHGILEEPQNFLAWRFRQAMATVNNQNAAVLKMIGRMVLHEARGDEECVLWLRSGLDILAKHFEIKK